MNENEFEIDGKAYVAVEKASSMVRCSYCSFNNAFECLENPVPACGSEIRLDKRNVIFVEKQP